MTAKSASTCEYLDALRDLDRLVEGTFGLSEREAYEQLPASRKLRAFYTVWTRKEAYLKARGYGLTVPLNEFETGLDHPPAILSARNNRDAPHRWSLRDIDCGEQRAAAVCAEGQDWSVTYMM